MTRIVSIAILLALACFALPHASAQTPSFAYVSSATFTNSDCTGNVTSELRCLSLIRLFDMAYEFRASGRHDANQRELVFGRLGRIDARHMPAERNPEHYQKLQCEPEQHIPERNYWDLRSWHDVSKAELESGDMIDSDRI